MVEIYTVKHIDNSRLRRRSTSAFGRVCRKQLMVAGFLALALLGYTWQRYEGIEMSYRLEQLNRTQSQALELNRELRVELATLRSPERIDLVAQEQLGMTVPQPAQIIPTEAQSAGEVADASTAANPASLR